MRLTLTRQRLSIFTMWLLAQKMPGVLMTAVMFVTSVNCFCQTSQVLPVNGDHHQSEFENGCCGGEDRDCDDADQCPRKDSNHSCQHCQGTLVSEIVPVSHFSTIIDHSTLVAVLPPISLDALTLVQIHSRFAGDSPPRSVSPTLLGLHCALTL